MEKMQLARETCATTVGTVSKRIILISIFPTYNQLQLNYLRQPQGPFNSARF